MLIAKGNLSNLPVCPLNPPFFWAASAFWAASNSTWSEETEGALRPAGHASIHIIAHQPKDQLLEISEGFCRGQTNENFKTLVLNNFFKNTYFLELGQWICVRKMDTVKISYAVFNI